MKEQIYQNGFYSLLGIIVGFLTGMWIFSQPKSVNVNVTVPVNDTIRKDSIKGKPAVKTAKLTKKLNDKNLMAELVRQGVKHPRIVLAQAKLETGHYTSDVCRRHNNLFGLRHSKGYYRFSNWQQSVTAYKKYVQYKWDGKTNYYAFLRQINYAEDPAYTKRLKDLV